MAQRSYPPAIEGAEEYVYKTVGETELKLWSFRPDKDAFPGSRPAILFFFGGGWKSGSPSQFVPYAEYLAERGMTAMVVDYRVSSRHGTKAKDCVADARDALRYVRDQAELLGIDSEKVAVGGGSAGGHIAACLGTIEVEGLAKPVAMALFNPACVLAPFEDQFAALGERKEELGERMGAEIVSLSPIHHVSVNSSPAIVFHGTKDPTVPYGTAVAFTEEMKKAGVECVLQSYEGEGHGIFNPGRKVKEGSEPAFPKTLVQLDEFFVALGLLEKKGES